MVRVIENHLEIHTTPLEKITMESSVIRIEFDDINEKRWLITFRPIQAVKATTIDCVSASNFHTEDAFDNEGIYHKYILEVTDSSWICSLKSNLTDSTATFLNKARHFVLPFQDNILEIVAWEYELEKM